MSNVRIAMLGSGFVAEFYMQGLANVNGQEVVANYSRDKKRAKAFASALDDPRAGHRSRHADRPNRHRPVRHRAAQRSAPAGFAGLVEGRKEPGLHQAAGAQPQRGEGHVRGGAEVGCNCTATPRPRSLLRAWSKRGRLIENGGLGRVLWVRSRESHSGPHSPHFWDVEKTGGGAMNDLGCHCIEAARYFFGKQDRIVEVMAWGARLVHQDKTQGEDNALLMLKFASGGIGHCELSWTTKGGLDLRNEIHGSEGSIFTDVTRGTPITSFTTKAAGYVVEKADIDFGWTRPLPEEAFAYGYQAEMRHFVECVRDGVEPRETYEDGYIVNSILDAGYQAMRAGKWVRVKY